MSVLGVSIAFPLKILRDKISGGQQQSQKTSRIEVKLLPRLALFSQMMLRKNLVQRDIIVRQESVDRYGASGRSGHLQPRLQASSGLRHGISSGRSIRRGHKGHDHGGRVGPVTLARHNARNDPGAQRSGG